MISDTGRLFHAIAKTRSMNDVLGHIGSPTATDRKRRLGSDPQLDCRMQSSSMQIVWCAPMERFVWCAPMERFVCEQT